MFWIKVLAIWFVATAVIFTCGMLIWDAIEEGKKDYGEWEEV